MSRPRIDRADPHRLRPVYLYLGKVSAAKGDRSQAIERWRGYGPFEIERRLLLAQARIARGEGRDTNEAAENVHELLEAVKAKPEILPPPFDLASFLELHDAALAAKNAHNLHESGAGEFVKPR